MAFTTHNIDEPLTSEQIKSLYPVLCRRLHLLFESAHAEFVDAESFGFKDMQTFGSLLEFLLEHNAWKQEYFDELGLYAVSIQTSLEYFLRKLSTLKKCDSNRYEQFVNYAKSYIDKQLKRKCEIVIDELSLAIEKSNRDTRKNLVAACYCIVSKYEYPVSLELKSKYSVVEDFQTAHDRLKATNEMLFKHFMTYFAAKIEQKWEDGPYDDIEQRRKALVNMPLRKAPKRSINDRSIDASVGEMFRLAVEEAALDAVDMKALLDTLDSVLKGKTLTTDMIEGLHHLLHDSMALFYKLHNLLKKDESEDFKEFIEYTKNSIRQEREELQNRQERVTDDDASENDDASEDDANDDDANDDDGSPAKKQKV